MYRCVRSLLTWILPLTLAAPIVLGAPADPRSYAPVQGGPAVSAELELPYAAGRVMVRFTEAGYRNSKLDAAMDKGGLVPDNDTGLASVDAIARRAGVTRILRAHDSFADRDLAESLGAHRIFRLDVAADADIPALAAQLAADPDVESATPDWRLKPAYVPNDFSYPANWGHDNTAQLPAYDWFVSWDHTLAPVGMPGFDADTDLAWDAPSGFGLPSVVIAIIDTGVDQFHVDLMQIPGYDFGDTDPNPHDDAAGAAGHGTCVAGIAAAIVDNGLVAAGVAGGCSIMPLKVADSAGGLFVSYVANALYFAANNGANIANMSFSFAGITSDPVMDPAILYASGLGMTMISVTGNDNNSVVDYPGNHPDVIAVGAASPCGERKRSSSLASECDTFVVPDPLGYTCDGERWWGSNYGSTVQDAAGAVDVLAPTMLPTTDITGAPGYRSGDFEPWFNGTSCSAPYAAGICALMLSANPGLTPVDIRTLLVGTCTDVLSVESGPGWDRFSGYGLVNANMAVLSAMPPLAGFSAGTLQGCIPLSVPFYDQSQGMVTSWQWNFGDGGTDIVPNPVHLYNQPGTYTVTLTVHGPGGADTVVMTDLITVEAPTVSDFGASVTLGDMPLSVTFTDASSNAPIAWQWDFGDGQFSTQPSPVHVFTAPGLYTVALSTSNACGGDTMTKTDHIQVCAPAPTAVFSATPTAGADTLTVAFSDASTGTFSSWAWDFGDGGTSTVQSPSHTYTASGVYTVTLITSNSCYADTTVATDLVLVATTTGDEAPAARFALAQNYPNPFNPATNIDFSLARDGHARLVVFDASGRVAAVLVDDDLGAGPHQVNWRPDRDASGVYFAKLTADGQTAIRRLVLLR